MSPRSQLAVAAAGVTLLSCTALHACFVDTAWIAPVVGAVLAVLVGAELGSRLGQRLVARALWRLVGSLLAALFYLVAVWAPQGAILGFIPRGHTWHLLRLLIDRGFDEVHSQVTPAPTFKALMFLTAAGVALVAIAVDQLSIRPPLIGLPLLALYSVPEWLAKNGTGWLPLLLGGAGYVALLIREGRDRTSRWGRTVTGSNAIGRQGSASVAMSQAGWRIGATALAVALVVPPLLPDMAHFTLAKGGGINSSTSLHYNLSTNIGGNLRQGAVFPVYQYTDSTGSAQYLRFTTDDTFTKSGFTESSLAAEPGIDPTVDTLPLDGVPAAEAANTMQTSVAIDKRLTQGELPLPAMTTRIEALQGEWSYERSTSTVFSSDSGASASQSYTATSVVLDPSPVTVQHSSLSATDALKYRADLAVPSDLPAKVKQAAVSVTKGASTEYEKAVALQDFFTSGKHGYRYSLDGPSGSGYTPLVAFLTTQRVGYCQQYATAMAIMARTLGIPARVAIGFTQGTLNGSGNSYTVDNHDAHAWPELYFSGIGWLRFEPTPRTDGQVSTPTYGRYTVAQIKGLTATTPKPTGSAVPNDTIPKNGPRPQDTYRPANELHGSTSGPSFHITRGEVVGLLVVLAILLIVVGVPVTHTLMRRRRRGTGLDPREVALIAWRELMRDARDLGHAPSEADSPRQAARRLMADVSLPMSATVSLERLARGVELARYARTADIPGGLYDDLDRVSAAMYAQAPRWVKLRARTLPPSTTTWVSESLSARTSAVAAFFERLGGRLRGGGGRSAPTSPEGASSPERRDRELAGSSRR